MPDLFCARCAYQDTLFTFDVFSINSFRLSGIIFLFVLIALCYRNAERAKRKGLRAIPWGLLTALLFFVGEIVGIFLVVLLFNPDLLKVPPNAANDPAYKLMLTEKLSRFFNENPLRELTIELFALGGYLLARYLIEQKPELPITNDGEGSNTGII